jgi:hypothetical protein
LKTTEELSLKRRRDGSFPKLLKDFSIFNSKEYFHCDKKPASILFATKTALKIAVFRLLEYVQDGCPENAIRS